METAAFTERPETWTRSQESWVSHAQGDHTIRIKTRSAARVELDRIDIAGAPVAISAWTTDASTRIEAEASTVTRKGTWTAQASAVYSAGTALRSTAISSELSFSITGAQLVFIGTENSNMGSFDVFVDGATTPAITINDYSPTLSYQAILGRLSFAQGTHTIRIVTKTVEAVEIDRIDVYSSNVTATGAAVTTTYAYDKWGQRLSATTAFRRIL